VVERHPVDRQIAELRYTLDHDLAERREALLVERRVLRLHLVGEALMQVTARPLLRHLAEGRDLHGGDRERAPEELGRNGRDSREQRRGAVRRGLEELPRHRCRDHSAPAEASGEVGEEQAARLSFFLGPAARELVALALLTLESDARDGETVLRP
jgi:hypothetical protein